ARLPYNEAAVGPFNTVYDSISSGLIFHVSELIGIPSTTYRLISFPLNKTVGLRRSSADGPTDKPATLPVRPVMGLASLALVRSSPFTSCTAYPSFLTSFLIPKAVTTTSSIFFPDALNLIAEASDALISMEVYPT